MAVTQLEYGQLPTLPSGRIFIVTRVWTFPSVLMSVFFLLASDAFREE